MKSFVLIVAVIGCAFSLPVHQNPDADQNLAEEGGVINLGDMILDPEQNETLFKRVNIKHRNGATNPSRLWPDKTVYFRFPTDMCKLSSITIEYMNFERKSS